jgi:metallo-beta-lactamase class B
MAKSLGKPLLLAVLLGVGVPLAVFVGWAWRSKASLKGQSSAEPFRIAQDFYYVGTNDLSSFLLTGPDGHVLFAAGYPTTAPMVLGSIEKLGFKIADVKALLNSAAGPEEAGVLKELQDASGAELWSNDVNASVLAAGGSGPDMASPFNLLVKIGGAGYTPPRVDRRFKDEETIRVGPIAITAHLTPGGSRGCTSWTFPVRDGDRTLNVVKACGLGRTLGFRYEGQDGDIERSIRVLRSLPADIWVTDHGRAWGRYRKFAASRTANNPVESFVDPDGYNAFIAAAEAEFLSGKTH